MCLKIIKLIIKLVRLRVDTLSVQNYEMALLSKSGTCERAYKSISKDYEKIAEELEKLEKKLG
jgi:hypothetical protein